MAASRLRSVVVESRRSTTQVREAAPRERHTVSATRHGEIVREGAPRTSDPVVRVLAQSWAENNYGT